MKHLYIGGYGSGIVTTDATLDLVARTPATSASFLARHPELPVLYAVGESANGTVTAYTIAEGTPTVIAERSSEGDSPCHVAVHPAGALLAVANYGDGTVSLHHLDAEGAFTGEPIVLRHEGGGPVAGRQERSHAHQVTFGPGDLLYATDLGTDEIRRYELDGTALEPVSLPPGTGPRHLVFAKNRCYLAGELDGTVTMFDADWRDLAGTVSSLAEDDNAPSHIEVVGELVYVGNRGPDSISVLDADDLTVVAEVSSGGRCPRHFAFDGDRLYVANQGSGGVAVHVLKDGIPAPTGEVLAVPSPSCALPVR